MSGNYDLSKFIHQDGYVVTWLSEPILDEVLEQYERIWTDGEGCLHDVICEPYLKTRHVTSWFLSECFSDDSGLSMLREAPVFRQTADGFFGEPHKPLVKMYATRTRGPTGWRIPYKPHFDEVEFLKMFIYLTDCGPGALEIAPGTHVANRQKREEQIGRGVPWSRMDVTPEPGDLKPIYGKAGTVVIFTTDVTHCAGYVGKGGQREAFQYLAARQSVLDWRGYRAEDMDR